jgi:hypothetical protein
MSPRIPDPEYVDERIEGAIYALPGGVCLVTGTAPDALAGLEPIIRGALIMRYAIPMNHPGAGVVVPGLFFSERGAALTGREAWDFMQDHFQVFPRADVVGLNAKGVKAQVFLRELDFGAPVRVFAYASADQTTPAAEPTLRIEGEGAPPPPELLARYLPVAPDLSALLRPPDGDA